MSVQTISLQGILQLPDNQSTKRHQRHDRRWPNSHTRSHARVRVVRVAAAASDTVIGLPAFDVNELFQWAVQNGVRGSGLAFATGEEDWQRGMIAQEDQPEERPLLAIPYSIALTDEIDRLDVAPAYDGAHWGVRHTRLDFART
eukprot:4702118-Pyramimonas_sp.AAC.2